MAGLIGNIAISAQLELELALSLAIMLSHPNLAEVGVGAELGNKRWSH